MILHFPLVLVIFFYFCFELAGFCFLVTDSAPFGEPPALCLITIIKQKYEHMGYQRNSEDDGEGQ